MLPTLLGVDLASVEALRTYIPALFCISSTCIILAFWSLHIWKPTRALLNVLGRPFRPFLTLNDVAEYESSIKPSEIPAIEGKCLRILCFTQAVGWVFWTVLCGVDVERDRLVQLVGVAFMGLSWVRNCLQMILFLTLSRQIDNTMHKIISSTSFSSLHFIFVHFSQPGFCLRGCGIFSRLSKGYIRHNCVDTWYPRDSLHCNSFPGWSVPGHTNIARTQCCHERRCK